jgi:uncharacterized membrane protein
MLTNAKSQVLEWLKDTPIYDQIVSQRQAQIDAERRRLATERKALRAEIAKGLPAHDKALQEATEKLQRTRVAFDEATRAQADAYGKRQRFIAEREGRIGMLERELRAIAPEEIAAARADLARLEEATRSQARDDTHRVPTGRRDAAGWPVYKLFSTRESALARLDAIREARTQVDALQVEALDDLPGRIAAILAAIPPVATLEQLIAADAYVGKVADEAASALLAPVAAARRRSWVGALTDEG